MAETMNDLDENEMNRLEDFWNTKTSYILDSFSCQDTSLLFDNILITIVTIFVIALIAYILLILKIKK